MIQSDSPVASTREAPNVIVITCHDAGRYFGFHQRPGFTSPALDTWTRDAVVCERMFATSPVCTPSRGSLTTGLYPQRNGLMGLTHAPWDWRFKADVVHLAERLRRQGYRTALIGNQHEDPDTRRLGFDVVHANFKEGLHTAPVVAAAAEKYLAEAARTPGPFYAQIGFIETHREYERGGVEPAPNQDGTVPAWIADDAAARADFSLFRAAIRYLDEGVGRILGTLDRLGLAENTIVVFCSDHGIEVPRAKWYCYDAGLEVAFAVRWPAGGVCGGRRLDALLSNVDFLPTLWELLGLGPLPCDGISFAAPLRGEVSRVTRDQVHAIFEGFNTVTHPSVARAVRTGEFKLIRNFSPARRHRVPVQLAHPQVEPRCPFVQLFDLRDDPLEMNDVAGCREYAEIQAALDQHLWSWLEAMNDPILRGPVATPYYQAAIAPYVQRRVTERAR